MDVHAPHAPLHTWKDFWIHLGTITIGLLIAIGLEQSVEWMHRIHERTVLEQDLREEARHNLNIISGDIHIENSVTWMQNAATAADSAQTNGKGSSGGKVTLTLSVAPCFAGTLNSMVVKYFAPSEAVWTAARESGLTALIPAPEARVYARLSHNLELLSGARDRVAYACNEIAAQQQRFSAAGPGAGTRVWTMTPERAEKFSEAASRTGIEIKALVFRLRVVQVCEEAILNEALDSDKIMEMIGKVEEESTSDAAKP
jgi:hypothetical protein